MKDSELIEKVLNTVTPRGPHPTDRNNLERSVMETWDAVRAYAHGNYWQQELIAVCLHNANIRTALLSAEDRDHLTRISRNAHAKYVELTAANKEVNDITLELNAASGHDIAF